MLPYKNAHLKMEGATPNKICVIGDTGTGTKDQFLVASMLAKENCQAIVHVGDIIYPSGLKDENDYQLQSKFYEPFKPVLNQEDAPPFFLLAGNHDYLGDLDIWTNISEKSPQKIIIPHLYYSAAWKDLCFVMVDTNPFNRAYLRWTYKKHLKNQAKWLRTINKKMDKTCKFKLAFGHHPYLSSGQHGNAKDSLKDFFEEHIIGKYDAYLSGHDHNLAYEGTKNKTALIVSGAGAKLRSLKTKYKSKSKKFNISKLGYAVVTINRKTKKPTLSFQFRVLKNQQMETVYRGKISQ